MLFYSHYSASQAASSNALASWMLKVSRKRKLWSKNLRTKPAFVICPWKNLLRSVCSRKAQMSVKQLSRSSSAIGQIMLQLKAMNQPRTKELVRYILLIKMKNKHWNSILTTFFVSTKLHKTFFWKLQFYFLQHCTGLKLDDSNGEMMSFVFVSIP